MQIGRRRQLDMSKYFLDSIEEFSTGLADVICVNSLFTASVFKQTFKSLKDRELTVLYPSLNTEFFDKTEECTIPEIPESAEYIFTSLNRFEVKKNIKLAIEAFAYLRTLLSDDEFSKCHLVLAGGYDQLNKENIDYFKELVEYVDFFSLPQKQKFTKDESISCQRCLSADEEKITLLRRSRAVLYTPHNEHFGIVPVESMYVGTPVIAVNSGGPKESIIHLETGLLAEQLPEAFAECMARLVRDEPLVKKLRQMGPKRVRELFAFEAFSTRLDHLVKGEDS
ncbi:glycosyltransferase, group 1 family protein [Ancylostoma duodenale]|uniref:Alpha-1,3/1,6-mannosyltransferase ALG2 n=1 Tax=Ancylostoma duodenale TaxID=51022 RepID=A0A0C2GM87_9BILA|nr:glycosyltransferase, group 1 family protein [Ancylostoma duodenale]